MVPPLPSSVPRAVAGSVAGSVAGTTGRGQRGGCPKNSRGGVPSPPFHFSLSLFGFVVLDRPTRAAPAEWGETGATPPFFTAGAVRQVGGCPTQCPTGCPIPPRRWGGRSRL